MILKEINFSISSFFFLAFPFITLAPSIISLTFVLIDFGVILFFLLNNSWIDLLLSVSSIALCIDPVTLSAYKIALPRILRAALPIVCIKVVSDLRKPSLSASKIATKLTSGISRPSLNKLIPTSTSNFPSLKSLIISTLSTVSISECMYLAEILFSFK